MIMAARVKLGWIEAPAEPEEPAAEAERLRLEAHGSRGRTNSLTERMCIVTRRGS